MKRLIHISILLAVTLGLNSCERINNKFEQISKKVKAGAKEELMDQIEKIYPPFDHHKPDTENNRKRFVDFLKIDITSDIKNIYCFDDAIGIDADYMFAFNCNAQTSKKIIEVHNMTMDTLNSDNGFGLQHDFEWWDKEKIKNLEKYSWTNNNRYFKYFWYDKEINKAYFFDFDM